MEKLPRFSTFLHRMSLHNTSYTYLVWSSRNGGARVQPKHTRALCGQPLLSEGLGLAGAPGFELGESNPGLGGNSLRLLVSRQRCPNPLGFSRVASGQV